MSCPLRDADRVTDLAKASAWILRDADDGGDGDDVLFGEGGNDQVLGHDGSDALGGGAGNDVIDGGTGDDELGYCRGCADSNDISVGADTYIGGPGTDKLWFDNRPAGVTISLDGAPNDGTDGEGDNIGADDRLYGGSDDDVVDGGPGADSLYGDFTTACSPFACAAGNDQLRARDGEVDLVNCGTGADTARLDSGDLLDGQHCETVDGSAAPAPPDPDPDPNPDPAPDSNPGPIGGVDATRPSLNALSASPALSEGATVRFRVERVLPGRRVGGRCVKPTQSNRNARSCSRYKLLRGSFRQQASAGANRLKFTGRLRGSKLRPGKYRLLAVATDGAGNRSGLKRIAFRIVR